MFVDRAAELAFLDRLAERRRPTPGQMLLLYGRRRIGKTSLLLHWAERSGRRGLDGARLSIPPRRPPA